ncbi:MAG: glycosyltransferase family 4 protein [Paludibacteraceae bacterium]|nr:glycosyltransferase family 4 protein [Paludibacteraceae bacterium]
MKVAYFLGALNQGGTESLILDICTRCKSLPYQMVCIYRKEGNLSNLFHASGAPLMYLPKISVLMQYIYTLRKALIKEKVDIIHAQTPSSALLCIFAKIGLNIKLVSTMHGFTFRNANPIYRDIIFRNSDRVLFVSEYEKAYYGGRIRIKSQDTKFQVIYNGINFDKINQSKQNIEFSLNIRPKLVMVGNFNTVRSHLVVVKSIAKLKEKGIANFDFYFVGKRTQDLEYLYDDCVQFCEKNDLDNVHFLGARDDVPSILKSSDGFVYSSASDTFGIAVVEAMAAGLPVIVNDWVVMKEITKNGQWATLYESENVVDCTRKIEDLLNNLEVRKAEAKEIARQVREEYSIERHIERLDNIYRLVVRG